MAVTFICGLDVGHSAVDCGAAGGFVGTGITYQTASPRGSWSQRYLRIGPSGGAASYAVASIGGAAPGGQRVGFGIKVVSLPASLARGIAGSFGAGSTTGLKLNTDGTVSIYSGGTLVGTSSTAINDGAWHWIDYMCVSSGAVPVLAIDGVAQVTSTMASGGTPEYLGATDTALEGSMIVEYDDWIIGNNGSFYGDTRVRWLAPVSDNTVTNWRRGGGATVTGLYIPVSTLPPPGVASGSETDNTNIECASNTGTAAYRANLESYATAGITASDTILAVLAAIHHGEDITTGTKAGSWQVVSNPAIAGGAFNFGNDLGAHGPADMTASDQWWSASGLSTSVGSLTLATSPVIEVVKTNTTTRVTCVDAMGMYVAWQVPVVTVTPDQLAGTLQPDSPDLQATDDPRAA